MILNITDVTQRTKLSESTIRRLVHQNDFPRPVRLVGRMRVWSEIAVNTWIQERLGGSAERGRS